MNQHFRHQPDDPGAICPCCRQPWPDDELTLEKLIKRNAGRVTLAEIARVHGCPLSKVEKLAARLKKQPEPRRA